MTSGAELNAALKAIDLTGTASQPNTTYTITFANGFALGSDLYAINLAQGDTLTIDGAGQALDGGHAHRGFFVYGGNVAIDDLTIANTVETGGTGGGGAHAGGGGAGLGGGLFVASGAG